MIKTRIVYNEYSKEVRYQKDNLYKQLKFDVFAKDGIRPTIASYTHVPNQPRARVTSLYFDDKTIGPGHYNWEAAKDKVLVQTNTGVPDFKRVTERKPPGYRSQSPVLERDATLKGTAVATQSPAEDNLTVNEVYQKLRYSNAHKVVDFTKGRPREEVSYLSQLFKKLTADRLDHENRMHLRRYLLINDLAARRSKMGAEKFDKLKLNPILISHNPRMQAQLHMVIPEYEQIKQQSDKVQRTFF